MSNTFDLKKERLQLSGQQVYEHVAGDTVYYHVNYEVSASNNLGSLSVGDRLDSDRSYWMVSAGTTVMRQVKRSDLTDARIINPPEGGGSLYDSTRRSFTITNTSEYVLNDAALTGNPTAPTPAPGDNDTSVATTAFVTAAIALKADIDDEDLTGTPTAPTATPGTNTTQLATTAFVTTADNLKANIASPTLTGTPAAPTATAGTNTTQLATTAFVTTAAAPTAWVAPTLLNAWVNNGGSSVTAGYCKTPDGFVHLKGLVKNGSIGAVMFTLPAGYRPAEDYMFNTDSAGGTALFGTDSFDSSARLEITTNGNVTPSAGNNGFFTISGISFRAA